MFEFVRWFGNEVLRWRTGASVAWSVITFLPLIFGIHVIGNISFIHPINWVLDSLFLLKPASWPYILATCFVIGVLACWTASFYIVRPVVATSRLALIRRLISPSPILLACGHCIILTIAAWCYLRLIGGRYSSVTDICDPETSSRCLNTYFLFIILHSGFLGITYTFRFLSDGSNCLQFPIVQQPVLFCVKAEMFPAIKNCAITTLKTTFFYYPLYFMILGPVANEWVGNHTSIQRSDKFSFWSLFDVGLFWQTWLSGTFMLFLLNLARLFYCAYHTQPFEFPITATAEDKGTRCLHCALACSQKPIIQYLGYLDLVLLSKQSFSRRAELFSLSQPGGHPHNWKNVFGECISFLKNLTDKVIEFNEKATAASSQIRQLSGDRNIVKKTGQPTVGSKPLVNTLVDHLKKIKIISYFTSENVEAKSHQLFVDVQLYIWAVEALGELTVASYNEDQFGVVQKSLTEIIVTLLKLQESIEKLAKLTPGANKKSNSVSSRDCLKDVLKNAIYRIVNRFGKHLSSVPVDPEYKRRLAFFMDYKE